MRPYLIFLFVVFLNLFSGAKTCFAQTGWQWGLTNTHGLVESWNVVADRYSNSIVAGYYTNADTVNFGGFYISNSGPSTSMFIAKSDSSGNYKSAEIWIGIDRPELYNDDPAFKNKFILHK